MNIFKNLFHKSNPEYVLSGKDLRWNKFIEEVCSRRIDELSDVQKTAVLAFWYHAEMNSGGHSGYFDCYPEVNPTDLCEALTSIGLPEIVDNYKQALLNGKEDGFIKTDEEFFRVESDFSTKLMEYVEKHSDSIFCEHKIDLSIIGVYSISESDEVKLIEMLIDCTPSKVEIDKLTQPEKDTPKSSWQAAYDEHYLSEDGTKVIGRFGKIPTNITYTRLAFFLHFVDFEKPLLSQFGELWLPAESPIPDRLKIIVKYEPVD